MNRRSVREVLARAAAATHEGRAQYIANNDQDMLDMLSIDCANIVEIDKHVALCEYDAAGTLFGQLGSIQQVDIIVKAKDDTELDALEDILGLAIGGR